MRKATIKEINFVGDVFLDDKYSIAFPLNNVILNLEFPISHNGTPALNKVNLRQKESFLMQTFIKKPLAINLANNHIMDFGTEALLDTINYLDQQNIKYFGAGKYTDNYNNPCIIEFSGINLALMGFCCTSTHPYGKDKMNVGCALIKKETIIEEIHAAKKKHKYLVVILHWGDEEYKYPKPHDVKLAHGFIDAGADMVIGHHAHVIQSSELYKGKPIYYGLGNFIFPDLDVPSMFDGKEFKSRYKKTQTYENRKGLIVKLNKNFRVKEVFCLRIENKLVEISGRIPKWLPKTPWHYAFYAIFIKRKLMLKAFLRKPRLPKFHEIVTFLSK